ncbi:hypothetical protein [Streptococcus suis]|uniref:hypothetical protein n=1 Tax=Streptococcus suis TaxID=1307 RepID=UPI0038B74229
MENQVLGGNTPAKTTSKKPFFAVLVAILLLASLGANVYLLLTRPKESKIGTICGDEIIKEYNDFYETTENYDEDKKQIISKVQGLANYKEDANCVMLEAILVRDKKASYETILKLVENGENPSLKIREIQDLNSLENSVKTIILDDVKDEQDV